VNLLQPFLKINSIFFIIYLLYLRFIYYLFINFVIFVIIENFFIQINMNLDDIYIHVSGDYYCFLISKNFRYYQLIQKKIFKE